MSACASILASGRSGQHAAVRVLPCDGGYRVLYEVNPDTGRDEPRVMCGCCEYSALVSPAIVSRRDPTTAPFPWGSEGLAGCLDRMIASAAGIPFL